MKKLFYFLALMGCMVACNENKPAGGNGGADEAFVIKVQEETSTSARITIIPEDDEMAFYWIVLSEAQAQVMGDFAQAVQKEIDDAIEEAGFDYDDMIREGILHIGKVGPEVWAVFHPNTKYIVFAVSVNRKLQVVGDVVTYEFTTRGEETPEGFVDLNLPSGTKWASGPCRDSEDGLMHFISTEAGGIYPGQVPTAWQWSELWKYYVPVAQFEEEGKPNGVLFVNEETGEQLFVPTPVTMDAEEGGYYYVGDYMTSSTAGDQTWVQHIELSGRNLEDIFHGLITMGAAGEALLIIVDETRENPKEEETPEGYVDLALPSGTLWATVPEYNSTNEHGLFSFEFATALGYTGHIPSRFQWEEVLEYTEYSITTVDGVNGCKLVSKENGNELFIPIQGFVDESGNYRSDWGSYMSSTLFENEFEEQMLYSFDFNASFFVPSADNETDVRYQLSLLKVFETITREEDGK